MCVHLARRLRAGVKSLVDVVGRQAMADTDDHASHLQRFATDCQSRCMRRAVILLGRGVGGGAEGV